MKIAFTLSLLAAGAAALGLTRTPLSPREAGEVVSVVSPQEPVKRPPIEFPWPSAAPVATATFHGVPRYEKSRRAIADDRRRVLDRPLGD